MKLIGKLQDGTIFVNKGHGDSEDDLFEFKTDEGTDIVLSFFLSVTFALNVSKLVICVQSK